MRYSSRGPKLGWRTSTPCSYKMGSRSALALASHPPFGQSGFLGGGLGGVWPFFVQMRRHFEGTFGIVFPFRKHCNTCAA